MQITNQNKAISVSELTGAIKYVLEENFENISVIGEISNYKHHSSGHRYFTLKDANAQIACTMWKHRSLNFVPSDGMRVIISGTVTVYPQRGNYQIDCSSIVPAGQGDLFMAYEALKAKLEEQGYFDASNKKPLPRLPMNIAVATSPTGAAIRDILSTIERRFPAVNVFFRPTLVQGDGSAEDIVEAINQLQKTPAEVLIVGRGGGSIEDLWSFNTEIVANAIFKCKIPYISAVGHETDFTIADFVADRRAATPTAAAELATPLTKSELIDYFENQIFFMKKLIKQNIKEKNDLLNIAVSKSAHKRIIDKINQYNQFIDSSEYSIQKDLKQTLKNLSAKIDHLETSCRLLNPAAPLEKGFAYIKAGNKIISNNESLENYLKKEIELVRKDESAKIKVINILQNKLF